MRATLAKVGWYFIKTPNVIELYTGSSEEKYNPATGEYEKEVQDIIKRNCYATLMTKAKQFEEYGTKDREIIIVRFNQDVPVFDKAKIHDKFYAVIEQTQVNNKAAYRMEKVAE